MKSGFAIFLLLPMSLSCLTPVSAGEFCALDQLGSGAPLAFRAVPAPAPASHIDEWRKKLVNKNTPAKEPLMGSAVAEGVTYDAALCGPAAEYFINFTQKTGGVQGARAEMKLSFDYLCSYSDGGRYISNISVKAQKAWALPLKLISVAAELPPTSVSNCAQPGEPVTACIDLVLNFSVSPMAGSWSYYGATYTLKGDGSLSSGSGAVLQPGGVDEIIR